MFRAVLLFVPLVLTAQSAFDVASIKPSQMLVPRNQRITPDGIAWVNVTLADCIAAAWHVKKNQISGPDWLDTDRFDITARADHPSDPPQLMLMLQRLLAERLKLTVHRETGERPVYLLTIAKNGPKLHPTGNSGATAFVEGGIAFRNSTMSDLADYLAGLSAIDRPVIDKTGLSGAFDFTLRLFDEQPNMTGFDRKFAMKAAEHIFTDLREQTGLKLEPARGPVNVIVADGAQRVPVAN